VYLVDSALAVVLYLRVSGRPVAALWVLRSGSRAGSPVAVGAGGAA